MVMRCCFNMFYNLYNSKVGRWFHECLVTNRRYRRLNSNLKVEHSHTDTEFMHVENLCIKVVPTSRTNYAYMI